MGIWGLQKALNLRTPLYTMGTTHQSVLFTSYVLTIKSAIYWQNPILYTSTVYTIGARTMYFP